MHIFYVVVVQDFILKTVGCRMKDGWLESAIAYQQPLSMRLRNSTLPKAGRLSQGT